MAASALNSESRPLLSEASTVLDPDKEPKSVPFGFLIVAIAGKSPVKNYPEHIIKHFG